MTMTDAINTLDLAFVVDTTGSMRGLIDAARRQMITMMDRLAQAAEVDLHLGVVEYRDHPPQDKMIYRVHPLTGDRRRAQRTIEGLKAEGGGDEPEAVLDGVLAACRELRWRRHARRLAVLVGDAPPHGVQRDGDTFPDGCPCGETIASVSRAAEEARVLVYALGLPAPSPSRSPPSASSLAVPSFRHNERRRPSSVWRRSSRRSLGRWSWIGVCWRRGGRPPTCRWRNWRGGWAAPVMLSRPRWCACSHAI